MRRNDKIRELEKLLKELKAQEEETAVTYAEAPRQRKSFRFWKFPSFLWGFGTKTTIILALIAIILIAALPFAAYWAIQGSTFTESKGTFLERVQNLNELATAEAYTKVVIERQDNALFGKEIGIDLPGTKRQLLVVVPGSVKAGVDFSTVTEADIKVNEDKKTAKLTLPAAKFLGEPAILFDQVEIYSYEGLFRDEANIEEAYELAATAQDMMIEESAGQGLLLTAQENAERAVQEMFQLVDYEVEIEFEEESGE